jgi:Asp-tRNA(Asn)/Glu-tRNA(Gln) amidotransferase A subunit family amidase
MTQHPTALAGIAQLSQTEKTSLVRASLEKISAHPATFTRLYAESAIAAAMTADEKRKTGQQLGALAGLPISIKDLFDVVGEITMAGSTVRSTAAPALNDATVVTRLRNAGAAILGKTNMTEFAFSGVGINPHYGTPVNPADKKVARIPGGSSSGAAVSVAAGLCVAGIGSDTGGSIRIPAALCGLVGFKPTMRRVPVSGTFPLAPSLDTICAMAHSLADCHLIDSIIADHALTLENLSLKGLRFAVPKTLVMENMDTHVAASFSAALSKLSAAGAVIEDVPMSLLAEAPTINLFAPIEAYAHHQAMLKTNGDAYDQRVAQRMRLGEKYQADEISALHQARQNWIKKMEQELSGFDAVLMPTVPITAPEIAPLIESDEVFFNTNRLLLRNPSIINLLDGCAVSLPCHEQGSLPVGLMVAGLAMTDAHILAVSNAIEAVL